MTLTAAAKLFGVSLRAVNQWMAATKQGGLRALHAKPRGRPAGASALTPAQATNVRQRIVDTMPDQLKVPFYLWTRAAVAAVIARDGDVTVSLTTVGRYLAAWGFSVQQPVRRAYERNDAAIAKWLKREYPAIARDAKREGATIYWGDEMGLRRDHVTGTSDAPVGQTPVVRATGQRLGCRMISAITNCGQLVFRVFHGTFHVVEAFPGPTPVNALGFVPPNDRLGERIDAPIVKSSFRPPCGEHRPSRGRPSVSRDRQAGHGRSHGRQSA
jgi:transposase